MFFVQSFDNMKQRAKKAASNDRMERKKTGGGSFVPQVGEVDNKILSLLGNRATPLVNPYDCDAAYNGESGVFRFQIFAWHGIFIS